MTPPELVIKIATVWEYTEMMRKKCSITTFYQQVGEINHEIFDDSTRLFLRV